MSQSDRHIPRVCNCRTQQRGFIVDSPSVCVGRRTTLREHRLARVLRLPNLFGDRDDPLELRPLLLLGENVALLRRGEAALRRETELIHIGELRSRVDAALQVVLALERAALRRDEAERNALTFR